MHEVSKAACRSRHVRARSQLAPAERAGAAAELGDGPATEVTVSADGFAPWRRSLTPDDVGPGTRIYVKLAPAE